MKTFLLFLFFFLISIVIFLKPKEEYKNVPITETIPQKQATNKEYKNQEKVTKNDILKTNQSKESLITTNCIQNIYEVSPTQNGCIFKLDGSEKTLLCHDNNLYISEEKNREDIIKSTPSFRGGVLLNGVNINCH